MVGRRCWLEMIWSQKNVSCFVLLRKYSEEVSNAAVHRWSGPAGGGTAAGPAVEA